MEAVRYSNRRAVAVLDTSDDVTNMSDCHGDKRILFTTVFSCNL